MLGSFIYSFSLFLGMADLCRGGGSEAHILTEVRGCLLEEGENLLKLLSLLPCPLVHGGRAKWSLC
jgi:hypothetical protein